MRSSVWGCCRSRRAPPITTGNLLWISHAASRLKGTIEGGATGSPYCDATGFLNCAVFVGTGTLYEYDPTYDLTACGAGDTSRCNEWTNSQPVSFAFTTKDGGSSKVCTTTGSGKKATTTCKESLKPDAFGLALDIVTIGGESNAVQLKSGNVVIR